MFGTGLAAQIAAVMEVEVDGKVQPVKWDVIDLGMGTPVVDAGSFTRSIWSRILCFAIARGHHKILIKDRFRVPHPGETEVKVEDSPGVTIDRARIGAMDDPTHDYRFAGPGGPVSDDGLELVITAGPKSSVTADETCSAAPPASSSRVPWTILAIIAGVVVAGILAVVAIRRRRRIAPIEPIRTVRTWCRADGRRGTANAESSEHEDFSRSSSASLLPASLAFARPAPHAPDFVDGRDARWLDRSEAAGARDPDQAG